MQIGYRWEAQVSIATLAYVLRVAHPQEISDLEVRFGVKIARDANESEDSGIAGIRITDSLGALVRIEELYDKTQQTKEANDRIYGLYMSHAR